MPTDAVFWTLPMFTLLNRGAAFFSQGIGEAGLSGPVRFLQARQCSSDKQSLPPKACCVDFFEIEVIALAERWSSMPPGEREIFRSGRNLALVVEGTGSR
jgi:hypothetical protein